MSLHGRLARASLWLWPMLIGHLWQATLFAGCALLAVHALKRRRAQTRHAVLLVALLKFAVPSVLLAHFAAQLGIDASSLFGPLHSSAENAAAISQLTAPIIELTDSIIVDAQPALEHTEWLCALTVLWLTGGGLLLGLWWKRRLQLARAVRSGQAVEDGREFEAFKRARSRLAVKRHVRLVKVAHKTEPGVWRTWRPVLVLPEGLADHLSDDELEAVMLHELAHVERRDNLFSNIQMWIRCVFWFHPLVWLIDRKLLSEREQACDERVLGLNGFSAVYASSILKVCRFCIGWKMVGVSGITGSNLRRRIEQIMAYENDRTSGSRHRLLIATMITAAIVFTVATGLFSRSNVTAQNDSAAKKMFVLADDGTPKEVDVVPLSQDEKDVLKEIDRSPDVNVSFDDYFYAPLKITNAKLKVITREQLERLPGADAIFTDNVTEFITLPSLTLINDTSKRIKSFLLIFASNEDVRGGIGRTVVIEPGASYTFKGEWQIGNIVLPDSPKDIRIILHTVEFDDGSKWSLPTIVHPPPLAVDPPQPAVPPSTVAPAQPSAPPAVAAPPQPPAPPAGGAVYAETMVTTKAAILSRPEARYPEEAKRNGVNGRVMLTAVLSQSGEVTNIRVIEGTPDGLTESAIEAARQIKFTPAMKDNRPVSQHTRLEYIFSDSTYPPTRVSGGVLNGRAVQKPAPPYPQEAKDAGVSGTVTIQIVVDEAGRVVEAKAVSGHPLLRQASVDAAQQAQFRPTTLRGQSVKVSGLITYNFVLSK